MNTEGKPTGRFCLYRCRSSDKFGLKWQRFLKWDMSDPGATMDK